MKNYRKAVVFTLSAALLLLLDTHVRVIHLQTESITYKYCLHLRRVPPQKGDLCVFRRNGRTIVKYLMGTEGDHVRNINSTIYVNVRKVGKAKKTDSLTPVQNSTIQQGYVFVCGTSEDSFDSRYEEFGFLKVADIEGKAVGLW